MSSTTVRELTRPAAPWIERLARLGYVSIGAVYAIVGGFSFAAATGSSGQPADQKDAFAFVYTRPFGRTLLLVIAAGLVGYAVWRITNVVNDSDRRGSDAKGLAIRAGSFGSALIHLAIAAKAAQLAIKHRSGQGSDAAAQQWTARFMDKPFGRIVLIIVGLAIIGAALYDIYEAWNAKLSNHLRLDTMRADLRRRVVAICRFGIGARAVVFAIIGSSIVIAAARYDPQAARGTAGAFETLAGAPWGGVLLAVAGLGFIAYGVYKFTEARYRIVRAT